MAERSDLPDWRPVYLEGTKCKTYASSHSGRWEDQKNFSLYDPESSDISFLLNSGS